MNRSITELEALADPIIDEFLLELVDELSKKEAEFTLDYVIRKLSELDVDDIWDA